MTDTLPQGARSAVTVDGVLGCPRVPAACLVAARAAAGKLGESTVVLEMGGMLGITDAFVVTNGRSSRQVRSIVEEVERQVKESGGPGPSSIEGLDDYAWVLMDYGDFLVHVFTPEARELYDLERLWADAPRVPWTA
ncbi:MAG: ribosome silencing factor [Actinobacteria bacterium]|nr:ribosome silencing factor [Actinomycetota bacterium]